MRAVTIFESFPESDWARLTLSCGHIVFKRTISEPETHRCLVCLRRSGPRWRCENAEGLETP